jgi:glycosyltransferase involved in cell wall biosynthesis
MACGLPVVASPVGVNSTIVEEGKEGLLASDLDEWEQYLRRLIDDRGLRQALGTAGRDKVVQTYSLQSQTPRLIEALRSVVR